MKGHPFFVEVFLSILKVRGVVKREVARRSFARTAPVRGLGLRSRVVRSAPAIFPGIALLAVAPLTGQVVPPPSTSGGLVVAISAEHCSADFLWASFAGKGYRDLWTTPIQVPVADLGELGGGGLTPMRVGGGMTTQTLHLRGADGRRYVARSVEKDTRQALPEEFWGTPVEAVYQDQLCSFHPSGAVIVAKLLEAVNVLHVQPQLLVLPDDPRLGEFREQFAGMLVLFEERPDDLEDGEAGFANSRRIEQTDDFFDELEESPDERVELQELLRARLVDLLVGDRDRSVNNHLWARFDEAGGGHLWRVIPRDRDQSFVRFDGPAKTLGRLYDPRLVSFADDFSNTKAVTRNAWDIDRNLLVGLDRESWDAAVADVKAALTDGVIADAVRQMPNAHFDLVGAEIELSLRLRRNQLEAAADDFYRIIFQEADIHGTDTDEVAVLSPVTGGGLELSLFQRDTGSEPIGPPHFQRTFLPGETKELRVYMHGGDDLIRIDGQARSSIKVRFIGGGGRDEIQNSGGKVDFFDDGDGTVVGGSGTKWKEKHAPRPYSWWVDGEETPDFGDMKGPQFKIGYDVDRGFTPAVGIWRDRYGFLKSPFSSRLQLSAGWAFGNSQPVADYYHHFRSILGGGDLILTARYSGVDLVRFYGFGNGTEDTEDGDYYKADLNQLSASASIAFWDGDDKEFAIGPVFRRTDSDTINPGTFLADSSPYGSGIFVQAGVQGSMDLDTRDTKNAPSSGYHIAGGAAYYPGALDLEEAYGEVHGQAAIYVSPGGLNPTLALRAGGKKLFGTFPFYDAAFLGGPNSVRGLPDQRFAGDASLFGSAELRVLLFRSFFVVPFDLGVFGLSDAGKVFRDGDPAGDWHTAFGGGIWLAPIVRDATIQLSWAKSETRSAFYVGMGFVY